MSEFDKEAEREKLREQLEAEQADREATQRMSELLLGGATMTGKHCERCASPIFRQNGREFCPTCNRAVGETAQAQADPEALAEADDQPAAETSDDGTDRTVDATGGGQPKVEPSESTTRTQPEVTGDEPTPAPDVAESTSASDVADSASTPDAGGSAPAREAGEVAVPEKGGSSVPQKGDGDLAGARDALARKLTRLAAQAEATDDVGHARELLAATREAAEALAALERVGDGR